MSVLNPYLYAALMQRFGDVVVSNAGEAMISEYRKVGLGDEDRMELVVEHSGEYYRVNCPRCTDTTHRLYINHRWGWKDAHGNRNLWLLVCYNDEGKCFAKGAEQYELFEDLSGTSTDLKQNRLPLKRGNTVSTRLEDIELPGTCTPLHRLPASHPANVYLARRQYDPERLSKYYKLSYCSESYLYLARNRIIAPVYCKGKLAGYQARLPQDLNWKKEKLPKWWTGPGTPRSRVFYNYDRAKQFRTGVIVEGPADVWGFGPMCHAVMGSTVTKPQCDLFVRAHRDGSGVIMLDPEMMKKKKTLKTIQYLKRKLKHGLAVIVLPKGQDPGSLERKWAREFVWHQAKKQGVKISWERK